MGDDVKKEIEKLIEIMKGFNNDPNVVNQGAKAIVITKLEEASMWLDKC